MTTMRGEGKMELMEIKVNGETIEIEDGLAIGQLLAQLNIENRNLAIEYNGEFLDGEDLEKIVIAGGDKLEIVRFVGGG
jgi:sulfur carrier protein